MKKVFFSVFMLFGVFCFSQNISKKFNSVYKRYEYFDSNGNMIGYEKYNNVLKQYEYYSTNNSQSPQTRQPYQYRDPEKLDISVLGNAMITKQNRYNNAQAVINDIVYQINSLSVSQQRKTKILNAFKKTVEMNSRRISNGNVDWLYEVTNLIINDNSDTSNTPESTTNASTTSYSNAKSISSYYGRTLKVWSIYEYIGNQGKTHSIQNDSFVIVNENYIQFKKADGSISYRELKNKKYNNQKLGYEFSSNYGAVFIHEDLKFIEFFNGSEPYGDNYTYFIDR